MACCSQGAADRKVGAQQAAGPGPGPGPPQPEEEGRVAHTWHFVLSELDELICFTGDSLSLYVQRRISKQKSFQ